MTFDQLWKQLVAKRSALAKDETKVEFTAGHLRKLLRQVYEQGQKAQRDTSDFLSKLGVGDLFGK